MSKLAISDYDVDSSDNDEDYDDDNSDNDESIVVDESPPTISKVHYQREHVQVCKRDAVSVSISAVECLLVYISE